jgi:hypothetical protein
MLMPTADGSVLLTCIDMQCIEVARRHFVYQSDELLDFTVYADAVWSHERTYHVGPNA